MIIDRRGMGVWNIYFASRSNLPYPPSSMAVNWKLLFYCPHFFNSVDDDQGIVNR